MIKTLITTALAAALMLSTTPAQAQPTKVSCELLGKGLEKMAIAVIKKRRVFIKKVYSRLIKEGKIGQKDFNAYEDAIEKNTTDIFDTAERHYYKIMIAAGCPVAKK